MSAVMVHPDAATMPVGTALKNLAKLHDLPEYVQLLQNGRTAVVVVHRKYAELWRAALSAGEFVADGHTRTATAFWMGARVQVVFGVKA